jgi:membrane-bound lytic murein transglycosylase B
MKKMSLLSCLLAFMIVGLPLSALATGGVSFDQWLSSFRREAADLGISQATINAALTGIQPIHKVIELDRKQPEKKKTFAQYKVTMVSQDRINKGRQMLSDHANMLADVEAQYGVPKEFIVALWGVETNYGANTGGFKIVPALATLAWEGRRHEFFKQELIKALKIIDQGHISAADMRGSWAGAMGQNQFMPSSFFAYAVDHNGDGHKDIWKTKSDVFASTANYLKQSGWNYGERWGRRVTLPAGFPSSYVKDKVRKPLSEWSSMGVRDASGQPLPAEQMLGQIVAPDGVTGEAYVVYNNYNVIMKWNRSTYFATSVGLIADALAR